MRRFGAIVLMSLVAGLVADARVAASATNVPQPARKGTPEVGADSPALKPEEAASGRGRALHAGILEPAREADEIESAMKGLKTIPGTDIRVGCHLGGVASWYEMRSGVLSWREPASAETNHVMITVQDASDRRTVPGCKVSVAIADGKGREIVTTTPLRMLWNRGFYYYGGNVSLPEKADTVRVSVRIEPPDFSRRDKELGAFFSDAVETSWHDVEVLDRLESANGASARSPHKGSFPPGRHPAVKLTPYPGSAAKP
jgi:hypothetical protein